MGFVEDITTVTPLYFCCGHTPTAQTSMEDLKLQLAELHVKLEDSFAKVKQFNSYFDDSPLLWLHLDNLNKLKQEHCQLLATMYCLENNNEVHL